MRIKVLAWSVVTLAAVALAIWAAAYAWLFSQEDYAPKPGTLAYYVGMSSLVRHAPVANAAGAPDYFGSVGDGDKAPRSEVSYAVSPGSVDDAYASMDAYLQSRGFQPRPAGPPAWWRPRSRTARNWCATPSTCPVRASWWCWRCQDRRSGGWLPDHADALGLNDARG